MIFEDEVEELVAELGGTIKDGFLYVSETGEDLAKTIQAAWERFEKITEVCYLQQPLRPGVENDRMATRKYYLFDVKNSQTTIIHEKAERDRPARFKFAIKTQFEIDDEDVVV